MVYFCGFKCFHNCNCCYYKCNNECDYRYFEELKYSLKYIFYIQYKFNCLYCWLLSPVCFLILPFDLISCPCRCCYEQCYKECSCTKINSINTINDINDINHLNKINKTQKTDLSNLPPHYDEHYHHRNIINTVIERQPPVYN
jgi:hypothetical protein